MVSSGQVKSDLESITSVLTSCKSTVSDLSGSWTGQSYDNLQSKVDSFISEAKSKMQKGMNAFASACDAYAEYLEIKQKKENYSKKLENAKAANSDTNDQSANIRKYSSLLSNAKDDLAKKKKEINEFLATAKGCKMKGVDASNLSLSGHKFVNYYQFNYSQAYSEGTIATSGCGPTSAAMALTYITGKEITPVETAKFGNGTYTCSQGTYWSYFAAVSEKYNVKCSQKEVSTENIKNGLKNGKPVIMSMGPGHFTRAGHFIVLREINKDGKVVVADPNSKERSEQVWDMDVFLSEGKQIWTFPDDK